MVFQFHKMVFQKLELETSKHLGLKHLFWLISFKHKCNIQFETPGSLSFLANHFEWGSWGFEKIKVPPSPVSA